MSAALTSTPSPAASPRSSFHIQRAPVYSASSPRSTSTSRSYAAASNSPKRPFHAPPLSSGAGSREPRASFVESPAISKEPRFVDAGTQYSPDGYPPTARTHAAGEVEGSGTKKRKERQEPSPQPMSTSSSSSTSATSSGGATGQPPPEPEPRIDPHASTSQTAVQQPSANNVETKRLAEANHGQQEPKEVRSTQDAPKRSRPAPRSSKIMPLLYQNCNPKDLGVLIANMLMELIRLNDEIPLRDGRLTRFHSRAPPGISVSDYLQRLIHHATLSPPILLSMVWYIDRLCQLYPAFTINSLTVHRFLITAATVAAKGLSDSFWTNPTYAKIGGIPIGELATLELEFLQKVQWKIVPRPETLEEYYRSLVDRTEGYELEAGGANTSDSSSVGSSEDGEAEQQSQGNRDRDEDMADEPT